MERKVKTKMTHKWHSRGASRRHRQWLAEQQQNRKTATLGGIQLPCRQSLRVPSHPGTPSSLQLMRSPAVRWSSRSCRSLPPTPTPNYHHPLHPPLPARIAAPILLLKIQDRVYYSTHRRQTNSTKPRKREIAIQINFHVLLHARKATGYSGPLQSLFEMK
ncbi:hypothetical protein E2986_13304 [Frieseomelitta varia]|uniref:Uncharacterized protein n=1 Tax=Frieseomelitta varia TaxID=561572 RepID=A0A833SHM8_9HYME|nr:hypothetical protein E2986_13304 [Frieseomelitta varia]